MGRAASGDPSQTDPPAGRSGLAGCQFRRRASGRPLVGSGPPAGARAPLPAGGLPRRRCCRGCRGPARRRGSAAVREMAEDKPAAGSSRPAAGLVASVAPRATSPRRAQAPPRRPRPRREDHLRLARRRRLPPASVRGVPPAPGGSSFFFPGPFTRFNCGPRLGVYIGMIVLEGTPPGSAASPPHAALCDGAPGLRAFAPPQIRPAFTARRPPKGLACPRQPGTSPPASGGPGRPRPARRLDGAGNQAGRNPRSGGEARSTSTGIRVPGRRPRPDDGGEARSRPTRRPRPRLPGGGADVVVLVAYSAAAAGRGALPCAGTGNMTPFGRTARPACFARTP